MRLPTPIEVKTELPLGCPERVRLFRKTAIEILARSDSRLAVIMGPCSIHNFDSAIEYAEKMKALSEDIEHKFFPIMRVCFEKPRTKLGWKGYVYDPYLDGSNRISEGIRKSRELFMKITEIGVPCASELLEPMLLPYFDDFLTWGLVGARTCSSQPHRQMASGLHFPVGFKNGYHGDVEAAVFGIATSRMPHSHLGINLKGQIAHIQTEGNPFSHLVLRGSEVSTNYDRKSVQKALESLSQHHLEERLMIDCSHGNCGKDHAKQINVFESVVEQAEENPAICGLMLESNLFSGKQPLADFENLTYGVSVTDSCLGWKETSDLLRSTSISWVQK